MSKPGEGYAEALAGAGQLAEAIGEYEQILRLMTEKSADAPDEFSRRYFFLKLVEMGQRPKDQRDWAPLKLILDEAATKAPNDPWVPLMSADISMVEEASGGGQAHLGNGCQDHGERTVSVDGTRRRGAAAKRQ